MIEVKEVRHYNWQQCIELDVYDWQKSFVNPNIFSLAEAFAHSDANKEDADNYYRCIPKAIYKDNEMMGFVMITYEKECDYDENPGYEIYRLMIDKKYQQNGYGKEVIKMLIEYIKTFPYGEANHIYASWHPDNKASEKLCLGNGFEVVGKDDDGAVISRLRLND